MYKEIKNLNIKLNQKEDDIKNIINEKDNIIQEMEKKLLKQQQINTINNNEILKLNNKIEKLTYKLESESQDKENKISNINNNFAEIENNLLNVELMNEERAFELETTSPFLESNSDEDKNKTNNNNLYIGSIYCMLKLNPIFLKENNRNMILNLLAIGFSNNLIMIINLLSMKIHQIIKTTDSVYSLCQHNNNSKYLFSSLSNGLIMMYELQYL